MDFPDSKEILHHFNLLLSEIDALLLLTMFSTYVIGKWPPTLQQLGYIQDAAGEVGGSSQFQPLECKLIQLNPSPASCSSNMKLGANMPEKIMSIAFV